MEERNELSDILLEQRNSNKAAKIKRLIVVAVLLVLLFVLVLMIMKFISKPDDASSALTDSMLQNAQPQNVIDIPAVNSSDTYDTEPYGGGENVSSSTMENTSHTDITVIGNDSVNVSPNIIDTPAAISNTPKQQTSKQPATPKTSSQAALANTPKSGHYIQVGAFSETPSKNFLDAISKKGYQYHLSTVKSKRLTSVLVGPFSSEIAARAELSNIKSSIAQSAFYKYVQ
jgi:DedD protein